MAHYITAAVEKLLTYGDCRNFREWPNYLELGLTAEHIPELIDMVLDEDLMWADSDSLEVWAPVHAWRALGQLKAEEAVEPLLELFHEGMEDDDWIADDLPQMYAEIGPQTIPALTRYLRDRSHPHYARGRAAIALEFMGKTHPETRQECIDILTEELANFTDNPGNFNASMIGHLISLEAVESLPTIREAFEKECVEYTVNGDIEEIEVALGVREKRESPIDYPTLQDQYPYIKEMFKEKLQKALKNAGRNDPCPCGSGKKYKKCCLNKAQDPTIREFVSLSSKKQIVFDNAAQKEHLIRLIDQDKLIPAVRFVQERAGVEKRLAKEYIERLNEKFEDEDDFV